MKTVEEFYNAYYKIDGEYHTNMLDVIDYNNAEEISLLNQALLKLLSDGEVLFVIDDNTDRDVSAFILYRKGDLILNQFILFERDKFVYEANLCSWQFPVEEGLTEEDKETFIKKLTNLIAFDNINLEIKNYMLSNHHEILNEEMLDLTQGQIAIIKALAFFWRYIYIFFMFASVIILRISNEKPVSNIILGGLGLIYCLYFFIGIRLNLKHVYYAIQKNLKNEVDYNNMRFDKSTLKSQNRFLLIISMASIVLVVIGILEI
jgi:hypothetical protein